MLENSEQLLLFQIYFKEGTHQSSQQILLLAHVPTLHRLPSLLRNKSALTCPFLAFQFIIIMSLLLYSTCP